MISHYVMSRAKRSLAWVANCSFFTSLVCVCVCVYVCVSVSVCLCACMGHLLIQACLMVWGGKLRISSIRYISCISLFYHWNLANKKILW